MSSEKKVICDRCGQPAASQAKNLKQHYLTNKCQLTVKSLTPEEKKKIAEQLEEKKIENFELVDGEVSSWKSFPFTNVDLDPTKISKTLKSYNFTSYNKGADSLAEFISLRILLPQNIRCSNKKASNLRFRWKENDKMVDDNKNAEILRKRIDPLVIARLTEIKASVTQMYIRKFKLTDIQNTKRKEEEKKSEEQEIDIENINVIDDDEEEKDEEEIEEKEEDLPKGFFRNSKGEIEAENGKDCDLCGIGFFSFDDFQRHCLESQNHLDCYCILNNVTPRWKNLLIIGDDSEKPEFDDEMVELMDLNIQLWKKLVNEDALLLKVWNKIGELSKV